MSFVCVAVVIHGCGSSSASAPTLATLGADCADKTCCDDAGGVVVSDVVNSLETMERIEILEFLKVGIVIRQVEEGPMRTSLIMNSHRLATFQEIKTEVTNVKQAQSADIARKGDAMDVDPFSKGSSKGASIGVGKNKDSDVVCWYCEKVRPQTFRLPQETEGPRQETVEGFEDGRLQRKRQQEGVQVERRQDGSHVDRLQLPRTECI